MSPHFLVHSLSAQAPQPAGGGFSLLLPLMLVAMVLLLWLPMRRQKKAVTQVRAKQETMSPGTRVMTNFGLYGTVRAIDRDANQVVLEVAPGTVVTVHLQTVTTVVEDAAAAAEPVAGRDAHPAPGGTTPDAGSSAAYPRDDDAPRDPGQRSD